MGIEIGLDDGEDDDFGNPLELASEEGNVERIDIRKSEISPFVQRRRAETMLVNKWLIFGDIASSKDSSSILSLSDGITSHMVLFVGIVKGEDCYLAQYHDPWGPDKGSLLQEGKNVGGCAATSLDHGLWEVPIEQLVSVLDGVITVHPGEHSNERPQLPPGPAR